VREATEENTVHGGSAIPSGALASQTLQSVNTIISPISNANQQMQQEQH